MEDARDATKSLQNRCQESEEKDPRDLQGSKLLVDSQSEGRYIALLVAYNSIKKKYQTLQRSLKGIQMESLSTPLNQLDSPTEADQLQMLLEMKTKECESLTVKVERLSTLEKQYLSDIETGQENLKYAIGENEKLQRELVNLQRKFRPGGQNPVAEMTSEQASQVYEEKILSRGSIDRTLVVEPLRTGDFHMLNRQVQVLTLEKKQLMTHVHWLTNELRNKDSRLTDISQIVSGYSSSLSTEELAKALQVSLNPPSDVVSLEEGVQRSFCDVPAVFRQTADVSTQTSRQVAGEATEIFRERIRSLHSTMLTLKTALQDGMRTSDSIQKSAVQSVRHPFEPQLYAASFSNEMPSFVKSPSEGMLCTKPRSSMAVSTSSLLHTSKGQRGQIPGDSSKCNLEQDDSQCHSVYHSALASPQDCIDDDSDLYARRNGKLSARRRTLLDPCCKNEIGLAFAEQLASKLPFREENTASLGDLGKRYQINCEQHDISQELLTANLVGPELQNYRARKLLYRDQHAESPARFEWRNKPQEDSERMPMMSLGVYPHIPDVPPKPRDESI